MTRTALPLNPRRPLPFHLRGQAVVEFHPCCAAFPVSINDNTICIDFYQVSLPGLAARQSIALAVHEASRTVIDYVLADDPATPNQIAKFLARTMRRAHRVAPYARIVLEMDCGLSSEAWATTFRGLIGNASIRLKAPSERIWQRCEQGLGKLVAGRLRHGRKSFGRSHGSLNRRDIDAMMADVVADYHRQLGRRRDDVPSMDLRMEQMFQNRGPVEVGPAPATR